VTKPFLLQHQDAKVQGRGQQLGKERVVWLPPKVANGQKHAEETWENETPKHGWFFLIGVSGVFN